MSDDIHFDDCHAIKLDSVADVEVAPGVLIRATAGAGRLEIYRVVDLVHTVLYSQVVEAGHDLHMEPDGESVNVVYDGKVVWVWDISPMAYSPEER